MNIETEDLIKLLKQCDDYADWMVNWVDVSEGEALFFAPDNELLVCIPPPETLTDAVQFLNHIAQTSTRWAKEQESQS